MMNKNLSIIIPMYNAELFIGRCLNSILEQQIDPTRYEIIIVNDGSTDNSTVIVEDYRKQHSHIKLLSQKNQGQSVARNRGIREASGEYLWFVDADDFLIPSSVKIVYDYVFYDENPNNMQRGKKYEKIDLITFDMLRGPDKDFEESMCVFTEPQYAAILEGSDFIASFPKRIPNSPCWYFIRKEFVEKNSLFFHEGKLLEDGLFTFTALLKASSVGYISHPLYYYALRPGSTMYTYTPQQLERLNDGFRNAISYLTKLLEEHTTEMSQECYDRLIARRNGYVVFLLLRMLKYGTVSNAKETLQQLKKEGLYPVGKLIGKDYKSWRMRLLNLYINRERLYLVSCSLHGVVKSLWKK